MLGEIMGSRSILEPKHDKTNKIARVPRDDRSA